MIEAPFAIAFAAGLVSTLNPCGFAMLPAYLSYFMGATEDEELSRSASLRRALVVGVVMSSAFLLVFGVTGLAITLGFRAVIDWIPWIALAVGALVAVLGVGHAVRIRTHAWGCPRRRKAGNGKGPAIGFRLRYLLRPGVPVLHPSRVPLSGCHPTDRLQPPLRGGDLHRLRDGNVHDAHGRHRGDGARQADDCSHRLRSSARYINRISGVVLILAGALHRVVLGD